MRSVPRRPKSKRKPCRVLIMMRPHTKRHCPCLQRARIALERIRYFPADADMSWVYGKTYCCPKKERYCRHSPCSRSRAPKYGPTPLFVTPISISLFFQVLHALASGCTLQYRHNLVPLDSVPSQDPLITPRSYCGSTTQGRISDDRCLMFRDWWSITPWWGGTTVLR